MNAMKSFCVLSSASALLAAACTPTTSEVASAEPPPVPTATPERPPPAKDVLCELVSLEPSAKDMTTARFRATNRGKAVISYGAYSPETPLYRREQLVDGTWEEVFVGWCGTGLHEYELAPGHSVEFEIGIERDGRTFRFTFGNPSIVTPPVSSKPD